MATLEEYKGSIDLISGLRAKNNGTFPLMEAHDILVGEGNKRLDQQIEDTNEALGSYINDVDALLGDGTGSGGGSSGGGSSGGLSIKSITFTDRPTAWEWLKVNFQKALKTFLTTSQSQQPIIYETVSAGFLADGSVANLWFQHLSAEAKSEYSAGIAFLVCKMTDTTTLALMSGKTITFDEQAEKPIDLNDDTMQEIPDAYWSALNVQLTCYYIE